MAVVKAAVRARDGGCVRCGVSSLVYLKRHGRSLQVHRITPGSVYTIDGCVTLCQQCHRKEPKRAKGVEDEETTGVVLRLPEAYREKLQELKRKTDRTITVLVRRGVDAELKANGIEPPPQS